MKIAHIVCRFPPYPGGMGQVAFEQVKRLVQQGHEVTVFTLNQKQRLDDAALGFKINLGFKIKYLKAFPRIGNAGVCPQLLWKLRDFDLVQLHYPFFGAQEFIGLAKALGLIKRIVIWYHMDVSLNNLFFKIGYWKSWVVVSNLFKQAEKVCCASLDYLKQSKIRKIYKKHPGKFIEIPFGTNQQPDRIDKNIANNLRHQLELKPDDKVVLFVGGLDSAHYFKGLPILIEAIKKLNDSKVKLIVVGDGNLRDDYERQVAGLGIENQVIFAGRLADEDLPYYYNLCDVLVLPSTTKAEAFGLVLVEAQTFGKPVIASNLPGVRDVVGQAGLTVKPGDVNDLVEKIKILLASQELQHKFSKAALRQVKDKYNWEKHVKQLAEVYTI